MIGLLLALTFAQTPAVSDAEMERVVRAVFASLESQRVESRSVRVMMFTAEWCVYCKQGLREFRPWLESSGWTFGDETAHVQFVDADKRPDLVREFRITSLPTFVLIRDGKEVRRMGYQGKATIPNLWTSK